MSVTSGEPRGDKADHYHPLRPTPSATKYLRRIRPLGESVGRPGPTWCHRRWSEGVARCVGRSDEWQAEAARQEGSMRVSSRGGLVHAYTGPPGPSLTARAAHGATRSDYSYRKRRSKVVVEGERW